MYRKAPTERIEKFRETVEASLGLGRRESQEPEAIRGNL